MVKDLEALGGEVRIVSFSESFCDTFAQSCAGMTETLARAVLWLDCSKQVGRQETT